MGTTLFSQCCYKEGFFPDTTDADTPVYETKVKKFNDENERHAFIANLKKIEAEINSYGILKTADSTEINSVILFDGEGRSPNSDLTWMNWQSWAPTEQVNLFANKVGYLGYSKCRICGINNGDSEYILPWNIEADGKIEEKSIMWPSGWVHYLEIHKVLPSETFHNAITQQAKTPVPLPPVIPYSQVMAKRLMNFQSGMHALKFSE